MGGISIWQLLIIVLIVVLLFGTKKLKTLGSDLGEDEEGEKDAEFKKSIESQSSNPNAQTEAKNKDKEQA